MNFINKHFFILIINLSSVVLWKIEDDKFKCPKVREIKNFDIKQVLDNYIKIFIILKINKI